MWDVANRLCLTFNGEIFNYIELRKELESKGRTFRTSSDTEVLLQGYSEWGIELLPKLNGMFALAILDRDKAEVLLARDRFGVKPLYWCEPRGSFRFASTPAALAAGESLTPNLDYATRGARFGIYDMGTTSPYLEVHAIDPGTWMQVPTGSGAPRSAGRYYDLRARVLGSSELVAERSSKQLTDGLLELLDSAIELRFRADAPVALSVSGGLDSGSIAAIARLRQRREIVGFCFGHPDDQNSEGPLVRRLADSLKIQVEYVRASPALLRDSFDATLRAQGAPFAGPSVIAQFLVFAAMRAKGFKVALGGQGGDEALQGYTKFIPLRMIELLRGGHVPAALALAFHLGRRTLGAFGVTQSLSQVKRYLSPQGNGALRMAWPSAAAPRPLAEGATANDRQFAEYEFASLPTLLRYEDRNSMGNSVESRLPFLDVRLVEYCLALPAALKIRNGLGKWALREAVANVVPDPIRLSRAKRGFDVARSAWIHAGLGAELRARLRESRPGWEESTPLKRQIRDEFSDEVLCRKPTAFTEAVGAIWYGEAIQSRDTPRAAAAASPALS